MTAGGLVRATRVDKPRVYWRYYPKSKRGFWCVTPKPRNPSPRQQELWSAAYRAVINANWAHPLGDMRR